MTSRLAALAILLAALPAAAEESHPNMVLIHPWAGGIAYERAVLEHLNLSLGLAFNETQAKFGSDDGTFLAMSVTPGASWFLTGSAPEGLWVGVRWSFAYQKANVLQGAAPSITKAYGGAVMFGYDAILGPGVALQAAVGLGAGGGSTSSSGGLALGGLGTLSGMGFASTGFSTGLRTLLGLGWAF